MKIRPAWAAGFVIASLCMVGRMEVSAEDSSLSDKQTMEVKEREALEPKIESVTQKETSEQSDAKQPEETAVSAPVAEKTSEKTEVVAEEAKVSEPKTEVPKQEEAPKGETQEVADRTVEECLVMARGEADFFLQKLIDVVKRNEALGIETLTDDQQAVNEKFVKLAGELNRSEKKKSALEEALKRMIEAHGTLEKASDDVEKRSAREKYQIALREASEILKGQLVAVETAGSLSDSAVLDVDESGKIIVVNAGKFQGMKVGMKFYLVRVGEVIGDCQIMEVREYLSAGLCKIREKENSVQLGDRLLPVVTKK